MTQLDAAATATVLRDQDKAVVQATLRVLAAFCVSHPHIQLSHGWHHAVAVYEHATRAIEHVQHVDFDSVAARDVLLAALLHDVDDRKYFPAHACRNLKNARQLLQQVNVTDENQTPAITSASLDCICDMIDWTSCSKNGNSVPDLVSRTGRYYLLIPRWCDRLEAVGIVGVVRCYQYAIEHGDLLCSAASPRATTVDEVWQYATPERFARYVANGTCSEDMVSHYYDKLLYVARPPPELVQNTYLEQQAAHSVEPLLEVCLRYGRTEHVDQQYLQNLEKQVMAGLDYSHFSLGDDDQL